MLPTEYQQFIHLSRYARWNYENGRRETWDETVERYFEFFTDHLDKTERQFNTFQNSFEDLKGKRRNGLERQLNKIGDLQEAKGLADESSDQVKLVSND